jgi:dephospho-CoA kinase
MKKTCFVVGLTGSNAAGKGLAAKYFVKKGFQYHSLSDAVREEALKNGLTTSRQDLIMTGKSLRENFGLSVLAQRTFEKLAGKDVVDSFRHPEEVIFFRSNSPFFYLIGIDAPQEMRFERAKRRMRGGDSIETFEDFARKEKEENGKGAGQQLDTTFALADEVVQNDGTREELIMKLEPLYLKLCGLFEGAETGGENGQ